MSKTIISTPNAPGAVGPYSQAVQFGNLVFTAGQISLDPATGQLVTGAIELQTERVLKNLQAVLQAAGSHLGQVVKTTVFLQDMGEFAAMNAVYAQFFGDNPPARSTVEVAGLPLGARIEIEVIAFIN